MHIHRTLVILIISVLLLVACGGNQPSAPSAGSDESGESQTADAPATDDLRSVTIAFSFIPNVQFAPFYVADEKGYYEEAGLDVAFDYNFETDTIQRVAQNTVEFAHGSGISVLLAQQQDLPVVTVMTQYQQFPVVFFSLADTPLATAADLQDKAIGIPGRFGASYYGLLALLYASDQQEADMNIQEIGFSQIETLLQERVDVASGYGMNEPVQLREMGEEINILRVADTFPLISDGIITNRDLIESDPDVVRSFVQATLRGMQDTLENTEEAFEISLTYIPEAELSDAEMQRKVLDASLPYWESDQSGYSNPDSWQETHTFLVDVGLLNRPVEVEAAFTNEFLE
jgi:NitT/TauT family transport system substrate-binding protein